MITYCPECVNEMRNKFNYACDAKSGCTIIREDDDGWDDVPKWKQDIIIKEETKHKLKLSRFDPASNSKPMVRSCHQWQTYTSILV